MYHFFMLLDYSPLFGFRQGVFTNYFKKMRLFVVTGISIPEIPQKHTVYNLQNIRYNTKIKKYKQIFK